MVIVRLGSKYASEYDAGFYWKDFPIDLISLKLTLRELITSTEFSHGFVYLDSTFLIF